MAPLTLRVVFIVVLGLTGFNALHSGGNGGGKCNTVESRLDSIEHAIIHMEQILQSKMELIQRLVSPGVYSGCQDALRRGQNTSGVYTIALDQGYSFNVYCEQQLDGGGWTVLQARKDGSVNFANDWNTYSEGFGQLTGEFWLGNEKIRQLTKHHDQELKIELTSPEGEVQFASYSNFWIEDKTFHYKLTVTGYSGGSPPGDAFSNHNGQKFSTPDQDHDSHSSKSCANAYKGGWWYNNCHHSNLNGLYGSTEFGKGLNWKEWKGFKVSMRATRMLIRQRA